MRANLFSQVTNDRSRGNGLRLSQGSFRENAKKIVFTEKVVRTISGPRKAVESPALEVLKKKCKYGSNSNRLIVELDDLMVFFNPNGSMIL